MSIQPQLISSPGTIGGINERIGDLDRKVSMLLAARTVIGQGSISGGTIAPGTINGTHITTGSITTGHIAAGSITSDLIVSGAIRTGHIAANQVVATHILAGEIKTDHIAANQIVAGHIVSSAITTTHLQASSVSAEKIQADAVQAGKIAADAVTAREINVGTLEAITTNMGNLTAGTITGGTIRSGTTGARWEGTPTALRGYALDGVTKTFEIDTGSGVASFTGIAQLDSSSVVPGGTISGKIPGAAVPAVGGSNALLNSSFENATTPTDGWTLYNNGLSPAPTFAVVTLTDAYDGGSVARLTNGTDTTGQMGIVASSTNRPKVRAGRSYTLSAYGMSSGAAGNFRVHIHWLDSVGAIIGSGNASALVATTSNTWGRATVTAAAPTNAVNALCYVWADNPSSGLVFYFDAIQLEEGEVATAYGPRPEEILPGSIKEPAIAAGAVTTEKMTANTINGDRISTNSLNADRIVSNSIQTLQLAAGSVKANTIDAGAITAQKIGFVWGGKNRAPNFSAEAPISGTWGSGEMSGYWLNSGGTVTRVTTDAYDGSACVETSVSGSANYQGGVNYHTDMAYKSGVKYTASIYAKSVSGATAVQIFAGLGSANSALLGVTLTTSWQRFSVTWTPSADVAVGTRVFIGLRTYVAAAAAVWRMDAAQIEEGELVSPASRRPGEVLEGEIGPTQITPNSITADRMVAGTITAASGIIADAAITNAKILNVDAGKITTGTIDANRIGANSITAGKLLVTVGGANRQEHSSLSMQASIDHFGVYDGTKSLYTADRRFGAACALLTWTNANNYPHIYISSSSAVDVTPGSKITMSFYIKSLDGVQPSAGPYVQWRRRDGSAPTSDQAVYTAWADAEDAGDGWRRFKGTFTVPAQAYLVYSLWIALSIGTVNARFLFDGLQVEYGDVATAYGPRPSELLPGAVGTTVIADGAITTDKITSSVITGKSFQTSSANPRVAFDTTGFFKTDSSGNKAINLGTGSGEGLQLLGTVGNGLHPSSDVYTVNWKNTNGDIMANVWGTRGASDIDRGGLWLTARNKNLGGQSDVYIGAYGYNPSNGTTNRSEINILSSGTATGRGMYVSADSGEGALWLIRGDGYSDFARADKEVGSRFYGDSEVESANFTTQVEVGPTSGTIRPSITTRRNTILRVEFTGIVRVLDASWNRSDHYITMIAGSERDGRTQSPAHIHVTHNALSWQSVYLTDIFFVPANTTATFRWLFAPVSGTWKYWHGPGYLWGRAFVVGYY